MEPQGGPPCSGMPTGRALHLHVLERIERALEGRSWKWLAETAGIPQSTLSGQVNRPKFNLEALVRIAAALEKEVTPNPAFEV